MKRFLFLLVLGCLLSQGDFLSCLAETARKVLPQSRPEIVSGLAPTGLLPPTNQLQLAIGLPLRNQAELEETLHRLYDPADTNYHRFLTPVEFATRFGPTDQEYQRVIQFVRSHGFSIVRQHANRLVLDVSGGVTNVEHAFQVTLKQYRHPREARNFFAPDVEPSVPNDVPVADMWGLSDYVRPTPLAFDTASNTPAPLNFNGTGASGSYQGLDFRNAYVPGSGLVGSGQIAAVAEFDGYYASDIATYIANCGYTNVPLTNILLSVSGIPGYSGLGAGAIAEVSLDIELLIAMAPGLTRLMVYEGNNPYTVFNRIVVDNTAKQISCSWAWSHGTAYRWTHGAGTTLDSILSQMAAQGQSFFQASGDSDAYTGLQSVSSSTGPIPVDSVYVTSVGGTSLTMSGSGVSWASETVWNWGNNTGSGGGVSSNYAIPYWQTNISMAANNGSSAYRNFPDVAMTADAVQVIYNNGSSGIFGGTSCAAPLWAGFTALVNQQAIASGNSPVGFLNPALYSIGASTNYTTCFHDITSGNNIGTNTPGLYGAVAGYDLATGLGTPKGTNLINALAPPAYPYFLIQPVGQTATNGASVVFTTSVGGKSPLSFQWRQNGTNLANSANISGATSNVLSLNSVGTANAGNYVLVVTNLYGSATSSVAALNVVFPATITVSPTPQSIECGNDVTLFVTATGTAPLRYQWSLDGAALNSATNASVLLTNVHLPDHSVGVVVTNLYGSAFGTALLTVQDTLGPVVTLNGTNPAYLELGGSFTDPGATAYDQCAGIVPVTISGNVATGVAGTNLLTYAATDGNGNTNTLTRTVIVLRTVVPFISSIVIVSGGGAGLTLSGEAGSTFILEASADLSSGLWQPLATNTLDSSGEWYFVDEPGATYPQRFYRFRLAQ